MVPSVLPHAQKELTVMSTSTLVICVIITVNVVPDQLPTNVVLATKDISSMKDLVSIHVQTVIMLTIPLNIVNFVMVTV